MECALLAKENVINAHSPQQMMVQIGITLIVLALAEEAVILAAAETPVQDVNQGTHSIMEFVILVMDAANADMSNSLQLLGELNVSLHQLLLLLLPLLPPQLLPQHLLQPQIQAIRITITITTTMETIIMLITQMKVLEPSLPVFWLFWL
jgi:hypothetical protein